MHTIFWLENINGRDHAEDIGIDGKIMGLREIEWEVLDWVHMAEDRDQ
jgi:hypothetical protein